MRNICLCTSTFNCNFVCETRRKLIVVLTEFEFFIAVGHRELQSKRIKNLQMSATVTFLSLSQSLCGGFENTVSDQAWAKCPVLEAGKEREGNSTQTTQTKHNYYDIGRSYSPKKRMLKR